MIIHISGASGSGKTTLGNKIKKKFKNKIVVKDIDDLRHEFVKKFYKGYDKFKWNTKDKFNKKEYQKYIDNYVKKIKKPLVFVGLNHMPWWHKNHYYDMHSTHNFYIKISEDKLYNQKCARFLDDLFVKDRVNLLKDYKTKPKWTIKGIKIGFENNCDWKGMIKYNNMWEKAYKNQKYRFLAPNSIFNQINNILNKELK